MPQDSMHDLAESRLVLQLVQTLVQKSFLIQLTHEKSPPYPTPETVSLTKHSCR